MAVPFDADVLVVGAGPVGLMNALALAANGVKVRIVEKLPALATGQRGAGIAPRTQEIYHLLGIGKTVKSMGGPIQSMRDYDPQGQPLRVYEMMAKLESTPEIPEPNFHALGQDHVCAIVSQRLNDVFGIAVEFNTTVLGLEQDDTGITVSVKADEIEKSIRAKYLVGADGGKGAVRGLSGAKLLGESPKDIRALIGDVEIGGLDREYWHRFGDEKGNSFLARPVPENPKLFFLGAFGADLDIPRATVDVEYLEQWSRGVTNRSDLTINKVSTLADWKCNIRMCKSFRIGRVFLAGDAAHVHSPTGGQGLNSGVMDAMNLSWKLALACKGLAAPGLLDTYDEERIPVISEMLQMTSLLANATFKAKMDPDAFTRPASMGQLGVHCRWSSIVHDGLREGTLDNIETTNIAPQSAYGIGAQTRLQAGDRAPDAPGLVTSAEEKTLFNIFSPKQHTVVVFDRTRAVAVRAAVEKYAKDLIQVLTVLPQGTDSQEGAFVDSQGHAYRAYGVEAGASVAIVRPDGVVGALLKDEAGIDAYFSHIFTPV